MVRHIVDPGMTIEQEEGNDAYYEYIICKSYHSSSRKKYLSSIKCFHWWYNYLKKNLYF